MNKGNVCAGEGQHGEGWDRICRRVVLIVHVFDCAQISTWEGRQRLFGSSREDTSVACYQG